MSITRSRNLHWSLFKSTNEAEDSWIVPVGEKPLESEIKELSICLPEAPMYIVETEYSYFHGMTREGVQRYLNEEHNQYHYEYIKHWF